MDDIERIERAMVTIRRRQTRRALGHREEPSGQAFDVLDVIDSGSEVTVSAVAEALAVDQPRASKLVANAVVAGFAHRVADQADGRRSILTLTEQGRAVIDAAHRRRRTAFAAATDTWTAAERAQFARLLTRFVNGL